MVSTLTQHDAGGAHAARLSGPEVWRAADVLSASHWRIGIDPAAARELAHTARAVLSLNGIVAPARYPRRPTAASQCWPSNATIRSANCVRSTPSRQRRFTV